MPRGTPRVCGRVFATRRLRRLTFAHTRAWAGGWWWPQDPRKDKFRITICDADPLSENKMGRDELGMVEFSVDTAATTPQEQWFAVKNTRNMQREGQTVRRRPLLLPHARVRVQHMRSGTHATRATVAPLPTPPLPPHRCWRLSVPPHNPRALAAALTCARPGQATGRLWLRYELTDMPVELADGGVGAAAGAGVGAGAGASQESK